MIKVYRYGLKPPHENAELVLQQMSKAHEVRNLMVESERTRRAELRTMMSEILGSTDSDRRAAKVELELLRDEERKAKARAREKKTTVDPSFKKAVEAQNVIYKDLRNKWLGAKWRLAEDPAVLQKMQEISTLSVDRQKHMRANSGLYSGTFEQLRLASEAEAKAPLYDKSGDPADPRFQRWMGHGRIAVQTKTLAVEDIARSQMVQIHHTDVPRARRTPGSKKDIRYKVREFWVRVISGEKRKPVWAKFYGIFHRPLPVGGVIKTVEVIRERIAFDDHWFIHFSVDISSSPKPARPEKRAKAVAVDIGWRVMHRGLTIAGWKGFDGVLRAGTWVGSDGKQGEVLLTARMISGLMKPDELKSVIDKEFNTFVAVLRNVEPPESWLESMKKHRWAPQSWGMLAHWRSPLRLNTLVHWWKENRYDGDTDLFDAAEKWHEHFEHLWSWMCYQRRGAQYWRRDLYRCVSKQLSNQYEIVVLKGRLEGEEEKPINLSALATRSVSSNPASRANRVMVAPYMLRQSLINAFDTTAIARAFPNGKCASCGHLNTLDTTEVRHTCSGCGKSWDQDENMCRLMLSSYEVPEEKKKAATRFGRRKERKAAYEKMAEEMIK